MIWRYTRYDPSAERPPEFEPLLVKNDGGSLPQRIYLARRGEGYLYVLPVVEVDAADMDQFYKAPGHKAVIQELRRKWAELSLRMEKAGVTFNHKYDVLKQLGMVDPGEESIPF